MSAVLVQTLVLAGGVVASLPPAEKLEVSAMLGVSSGVSLAGPSGTTFSRRSPTMLTFEVGITHPRVPWLEVSPGFLLEVEGRVGFGIQAQVRMSLPHGRIRPYALLGIPAFLAPYTLLGAEAGAGVLGVLHRHFGVALELTATAFFLGDDLMAKSALAKIDATLGFRAAF